MNEPYPGPGNHSGQPTPEQPQPPAQPSGPRLGVFRAAGTAFRPAGRDVRANAAVPGTAAIPGAAVRDRPGGAAVWRAVVRTA